MYFKGRTGRDHNALVQADRVEARIFQIPGFNPVQRAIPDPNPYLIRKLTLVCSKAHRPQKFAAAFILKRLYAS